MGDSLVRWGRETQGTFHAFDVGPAQRHLSMPVFSELAVDWLGGFLQKIEMRDKTRSVVRIIPRKRAFWFTSQTNYCSFSDCCINRA